MQFKESQGMLGLTLGASLAFTGVAVWFATYHHKTALVLMGLGMVLMLFGGYALTHQRQEG